MIIDIFKLNNAKVYLLLIIIWIGLLFFAILEFITPYAIISANFVTIYESPFYMKRILKNQISEVKNNKGRSVVIICKTWKKKIIYLKAININEKTRFIRELNNIAKRNSMFDLVEQIK